MAAPNRSLRLISHRERMARLSQVLQDSLQRVERAKLLQRQSEEIIRGIRTSDPDRREGSAVCGTCSAGSANKVAP